MYSDIRLQDPWKSQNPTILDQSWFHASCFNLERLGAGIDVAQGLNITAANAFLIILDSQETITHIDVPSKTNNAALKEDGSMLASSVVRDV